MDVLSKIPEKLHKPLQLSERAVYIIMKQKWQLMRAKSKPEMFVELPTKESGTYETVARRKIDHCKCERDAEGTVKLIHLTMGSRVIVAEGQEAEHLYLELVMAHVIKPLKLSYGSGWLQPKGASELEKIDH
jgi:hypothetical protein